MSYIPKPNTGALFVAEKKSASFPDRQGSIYLSRDLIKSLLEQPDTLVKISISGWINEANGKKYLSLKASEPYVKNEDSKPAAEPDEDVPF